MNHNFFKQLKNDPRYSLSHGERTNMRAYLARVMDAEVAPRAVPASSAWFMFLIRPMPLVAIALILAVSTSSVSLAAGGALPGDMLYPVKVSVNEAVELAFSPSVEAKANIRVRQAEERLRETELLAAQGKLDAGVAETAARKVATNIGEAAFAAKTLSDEGDQGAAEGIRARIASALSAHAELLTAYAENYSGGPRDTLRALSVAVQDAANEASEDKDEPSLDEGKIRIAAEAAHARAKERVTAFAQRLKHNGIPEETEMELTTEFSRLSEDLDATEGFLAADDYVNATRAYEDIDKRAYRALTILRSAQDIAGETDQEVVITLGGNSANVANPAPVALRAKTSAEPEAMTMSLMTEEATTSEDVADVEEQKETPRLEFRLRFRSGE